MTRISPGGLALGAIIGFFAAPYLLEALGGFIFLIVGLHIIASVLVGIINIVAGIIFFILGGLALFAFVKFTPVLVIILGALIGNWFGGVISHGK